MSDESKYAGHTPGPWDACEFASPPNTFYVQAHGKLLIGAGKQITGPNARLIADAPELLEERDALLALNKEIAALARFRASESEQLGKQITATNFHEIARKLENGIALVEGRRGDLDKSRSR